MPLLNMYGNRIDDLINSSDEKDGISYRQSRNATSLWLPGTRRNRVASHFKIEKGATGKNEVAGHFEKWKRMEGVNGDISKFSFLNQRITKCNWQKDEILNPWVDKERLLLVGKTPRHTKSDNQDPTWLPSLQQKVVVIRSSGPDTRLNPASADIVVTIGSQDVST